MLHCHPAQLVVEVERDEVEGQVPGVKAYWKLVSAPFEVGSQADAFPWL